CYLVVEHHPANRGDGDPATDHPVGNPFAGGYLAEGHLDGCALDTADLVDYLLQRLGADFDTIHRHDDIARHDAGVVGGRSFKWSDDPELVLLGLLDLDTDTDIAAL